MPRRFFIRACGNRRQRRGDIHVARVRAPLRCVCAVVSRRCLSYRSCTGRHKWRPYGVCRRAVVVSRRFFIRACGNRRQRRGDIHVARVRALSWFGGMRLAVPATGVINGAPTGYAAVLSWCPVVFSSVCVETAGYVAVRSWCPAVFSSVRVGTAGSVGATFMSPAWVRRCAACAPLCLVGVCLSASVLGVINGAPTLRLFCVRGKAGRFSIAGVRTPATGGVLTCVAARKTGRFPAWFVAVGTAPCGCGQGWCQSMRFT